MSREPMACIMYHSVGAPDPAWQWRHLTVPFALFEGQLRLLRRLGYRGVSLEEYQALYSAGRLRRERVAALTFDDGYLDNWVYAAPLLKRYGFTGTLFVSRDFVDPGRETRPQWLPGQPPVPAPGFLNQAELIRLDAEGVLDVQSHAVTHTWYPCGPRIVDFRHPGDSWHWMSWNDRPENKWRVSQPESDPGCWGEPVYEHRKALEGPRYFPDPRLTGELRDHVARAGAGFFAAPGWRDALRALTARLQNRCGNGRMETEEEYLARAEAELAESAGFLNRLLGKSVRYLCWPGGGCSPRLFALAARHYAGTTIPSQFRDTPSGEDRLGCFRFRRFGPLHAGENGNFRYLGPLVDALYLEEARTRNPLTRLLRGGLTRFTAWRTA